MAQSQETVSATTLLYIKIVVTFPNHYLLSLSVMLGVHISGLTVQKATVGVVVPLVPAGLRE